MNAACRLALPLTVLALGWPLAAGAQPTAPATGDAASQAAEQPTRGDDQATIDGGKKWLELIDAGKTGEAWDHTAASLKSAVTRSDWVGGVSEIRKPYGKLVSRTPSRFARTHTLPDAPQGDYAIVEYESTFAGGKSALEQLTWKLESDGVFRIAGYFIR
jgi:hypothetical protein